MVCDHSNETSEVLLWHEWRILHGRGEIQNFSLSVEKYFRSEHSEQVELIFQHEKRNFLSLHGHVVFCLLHKHQ